MNIAIKVTQREMMLIYKSINLGNEINKSVIADKKHLLHNSAK